MATIGFTGVRRPNNAPITQPAAGVPVGGGWASQGGGRTNRLATQGAKAYRDAMGLPSFEDLFKRLGGGGTREFGNAGAAGEGAGYLRGELDKGALELKRQQANIARARAGIRNPTKTEGFQDVMRLTNERMANEELNQRRLASDAASRRGFVGGYDPDREELNRSAATALAGYEGAQAEREAQQKLFEGETDLYGLYRSGRNAELGAYTDLTKTLAELPTKYLDSFANLYSGGGFGDIYNTSSRNVQFDTSNELSEAGRARGRNLGMTSVANAPGPKRRLGY